MKTLALFVIALSAFAQIGPDGIDIQVKINGKQAILGFTPATQEAFTIDPTQAPYYASGKGGTTTTLTASLASGSTSAAVASCSSFLAGQGVYIAGAGTSGVDYIGTVSACSGTALTFTPATSTNVTSGTIVKHDDTAAFQAALNAFSSGPKSIKPPDGTYYWNGPLQDTSQSNARIVMPRGALGSASQAVVKIAGERRPVAGGGGVIIVSDQNSGVLLGGKSSSGLYGGFTTTGVTLENITFISSQSNPCMGFVDGSYFLSLQLKGVLIYSQASGIPTCATGFGFHMPQVNNDIRNTVDDVEVAGFYRLGTLTEHNRIGQLGGATGHFCWNFDSYNPAFGGTNGRNSVSVAYLWSQVCDYMIVGSTGADQVVNIQMVDGEVAQLAMVYDPNNHLLGDIWGHVPYSDSRSTSTPSSPVITGGMNARYHNLDTGVCMGTTCPTSSLGVSNPIQEWTMNESTGLTLANSVGSPNAITTTGITWGTQTGVGAPSHTVPVFSGSASGAAANAAATNFTGAAAFSAACWASFDGLTTAEILMSTLDTSSNYTGWELGKNDAGALNVFIVNTYPSAAIEVHSVAAIASAGTWYLMGFSYDGSKTAAGTKMYLNGSLLSNNSGFGLSDTLGTASVANTKTVRVGNRYDASNQHVGKLGDCQVYSSALSASQWSALYAAGAK